VIVITLLTWVEEYLAFSVGWHWLSPLTVVPSHSSLVFVKLHEHGSLNFSGSPGGAPAMWPSITTVSARWHDGGEFIEIEIDDGL
jgi:hypothetical protein